MKQRILSIHASSILGGTELRAFQIASHLKDTFDLAVLFHCSFGPICEYYRQSAIPFWVVSFPHLRESISAIRQFKPDVIHIFGLKTNLLWRPMLYALGYRNLIGHIAGLTNVGEQPSWLRIKLDLWTSRFLKVYLSNSQRVADQLAAYGFRRDQLRVIHNGVTLPETLSERKSQEIPIIVSVGNLRPVKGHRYLVEALKLLQNRGVSFKAVIVGEGPDQACLQTLLRQYGLEERVQLKGEMGNTKILSLMESADIFALLSLSEGISGAAIEAMARRLPVVATDVGGMSELVNQNVEGYLVPVKAVSLAADRLEALLRQPTLRHTLGQNAYLKIKTHFNLLDTIRNYEDLYREHGPPP